MSLLQKLFYSFLFVCFEIGPTSAQEIVSDSVAKSIFCIRVHVVDFQKSEQVENYNLVVNGKTDVVSDRSSICVKLAEGTTYNFKVEKTGFTSPEYQWEYKDEMRDRRILTFYLFPSGITEREKQKLIIKRNKEHAKAKKKKPNRSCDIEGWYREDVY